MIGRQKIGFWAPPPFGNKTNETSNNTFTKGTMFNPFENYLVEVIPECWLYVL